MVLPTSVWIPTVLTLTLSKRKLEFVDSHQCFSRSLSEFVGL